jgi:hypothetical protein
VDFGTRKESVIALGMVERGWLCFWKEDIGVREKRYVFADF